MQIQQDLCVNCNDCSIARNCPSNAISRVPADHQYIPKDKKNPFPDLPPGGKG
jgi:electron transport complex protein RnfB